MTWILWLALLGPYMCNYVAGQAQRVAPGVPPQHYQQQQMHPPPPQGHHQVPQQQQYQQVPQQQYQHQPVQPVHQQPPVQHQVPQHQVPQHQVPQHQAPQHQVPQQAHHDHHGQPQQVLHTGNIAHEKEHIAEHFDVPIDTAKMTDEELQFHYFKMHDADNNNQLDGCELIKSLIHWHDQGKKTEHDHGATAGDKLFTDEELAALIDPILNMDDVNKDGFIDYHEFITAQQKAAANNRQ